MTTPFLLWSLGGQEIFLIMLIILLLFGGKRIPELAKGIGKGIREFKKASSGADEEDDKKKDELKKEN